jgi:hypothetical protein
LYKNYEQVVERGNNCRQRDTLLRVSLLQNEYLESISKRPHIPSNKSELYKNKDHHSFHVVMSLFEVLMFLLLFEIELVSMFAVLMLLLLLLLLLSMMVCFFWLLCEFLRWKAGSRWLYARYP